jgi:hypothetical protein
MVINDSPSRDHLQHGRITFKEELPWLKFNCTTGM